MGDHVLVADDDPMQAELVRRYLQGDGFEVTVVGDGRAALASVAERCPDLLVLDVMMPELDGLDVCRELGGDGGIPIVLLTARSTENDMLLGLYLGADDYVTKPFSPRELVARVRVVLRRTRRAASAAGGRSATITVGPLRIDPVRHEVFVAGRAVDCTPVEFELLHGLATRPGQVLTRRQLLEQVHGGADYLTERTVDSHIMNLRKKVEADVRRPELIVTVYGVGYKLADGFAHASPAH